MRFHAHMRRRPTRPVRPAVRLGDRESIWRWPAPCPLPISLSRAEAWRRVLPQKGGRLPSCDAVEDRQPVACGAELSQQASPHHAPPRGLQRPDGRLRCDHVEPGRRRDNGPPSRRERGRGILLAQRLEARVARPALGSRRRSLVARASAARVAAIAVRPVAVGRVARRIGRRIEEGGPLVERRLVHERVDEVSHRVGGRSDEEDSEESERGAVEEEVEVDCLVDDKLLVEDGGRHDGEEGEGDVVHRDDLRVSEQGHARVDVLDLRDARRGEDQEAEVEGGLAELPAPLLDDLPAVVPDGALRRAGNDAA
mmetsp:Transcript_28395/g.93209  ORF Transcript_28395/g.93209 Transcript_28395/m.93209 type:complete len:311 (-) Transcript_28395:1066-1998(-)